MLSLLAAVAVAASAQPGLTDAQHAALLARLRLQCHDADSVLPTIAAALTAEKAKDWAGAKTSLEAVIANCGVSPAAQPPRVMRAEIAWREKDYPGVIAWLKDAPRVGPSRLDLMASMLAMEADQQLGDKAGFARERSAVELAEDHALSAAGQRLGDFVAGGAKVTAYAVHIPQGNFVRLMAFTVSPADPMAMPESVLLTDDIASHAIAKQIGVGAAPYFLDAYTCLSHVTVKMIPPQGDQAPGYDAVKPLVVSYLTDHSWTSGQTRAQEMACAWPQYVAPGLTP